MRMLLCRLLFQKFKIYGSDFKPGSCFPFYRGREKLLINIFKFTFRFYISYVEPLFVVAKIIGLPGSSAGNNFVRKRPVNDVISH